MDLASHGPDGSETATAGRWPWVTAFDQGVGRVIEVIAALLVVAEVVILFAGVVFRYWLRKPLTWPINRDR